MTCVTFISEKAIVGAGHDFNPLVFTSGSGEFFLIIMNIMSPHCEKNMLFTNIMLRLQSLY